MRRCKESAWPFSSKAITTTAAPYCAIFRACALKFSSPSFKEMEFTIPLPCKHFKPDSITVHLDESTIIGSLAISGSDAKRFKNLVMAASESSMPSSMFTSISCAPPSTCWRATASAPS